MMVQKLLIKLFSEYVGSDHRGNKYYLSKKKDYLGNRKRLVVYPDGDDPSSVPPMWHGWLHYLSENIPDEKDLKTFKWQMEHEANMTGTSSKYLPNRGKVSADYKAWDPTSISED